jgi:hypothetical protein
MRVGRAARPESSVRPVAGSTTAGRPRRERSKGSVSWIIPQTRIIPFAGTCAATAGWVRRSTITRRMAWRATTRFCCATDCWCTRDEQSQVLSIPAGRTSNPHLLIRLFRRTLKNRQPFAARVPCEGERKSLRLHDRSFLRRHDVPLSGRSRREVVPRTKESANRHSRASSAGHRSCRLCLRRRTPDCPGSYPRRGVALVV